MPLFQVPGVYVEPMRPDDLDAVMEIERRAFPEPWTPGLFLHELKVPFSTTLVAREELGAHQVIGYVCWWVVGDEVHLLNLAVTPERRRDGIGRALVRVVLDAAQAARARSVTLEVRHDNGAGMALYRAFGFAERGLRKHYYGRGQHAVIMTHTLNVDSADGATSAGKLP